MNNLDSDDLLVNLVLAVKENNELKNENNRLRSKLIEEEIKHEKAKKQQEHQ